MSLTATSHLLTTSQRLAMLTALLVAILCQQHVHTWSVTTSGQWERSGSHILPTTNQRRARSPVHCASFCLQNARCFRFCHHTVSLDCFVDDGMTPPSGQVSSVEGAVCYDKIKSKTICCLTSFYWLKMWLLVWSRCKPTACRKQIVNKRIKARNVGLSWRSMCQSLGSSR